MRAVFESISELSQCLEPEHLDILFQHIASIELCDYNEYVLDFVRRFTANAIEASGGQDGRWYGIDIFWRLIEDESPVSADLAQQVLLLFLLFLLHHRHYFTSALAG